MAFEYQSVVLPNYEDDALAEEEIPESYCERQIPLQSEKEFEKMRNSEDFEENL